MLPPRTASCATMAWRSASATFSGWRSHPRHCEEPSDEAIHSATSGEMDCFASLAMTKKRLLPNSHSVGFLPFARYRPSPLREADGWTHCLNARNAHLKASFHDPEITMTTPKLLEPFKLGPLTLPNRFVMAPLTLIRATPPGMVPGPLAAEYYGQRASAGLLVTEASQVSQQGMGYQDTPGIYSKEQVAGWRKVTERVHANGGGIFLH